MAMTLEQRGLYRELLDHCWEAGSIPNSEVVLQKIAQVSDKEWKRCWSTVRAQFTELEGRLHHPKVDEKRDDLKAWHDNRREAGRKGAQKRWGSSAIAEPIANGKLPDSHPLPLPLPLPLPHTQSSARAPVAADLNGHTSQRFDEFWQKWPRKTGKDAAASAWNSYVSINVEGKVFACLERFLASGDMERGAIPNAGPSAGKPGWLADCHRDQWESDWPRVVQQERKRPMTALEKAQEMMRNGTGPAAKSR